MVRLVLLALFIYHARAAEVADPDSDETMQLSEEGEDAPTNMTQLEEEADGGEIGDSPPLDAEQLLKVHKILDANGDGKIDVDELHAHHSNISKASLLAEINEPDFFVTIDENKDGKVSLEEFAGDDPNFLEMARVADTDGDGFLNTTEEWHSVLHPPSNPAVMKVELKQAFNDIDKDQDGSVTEGEYDAEKEDDALLKFDELDTNHDGAVTVEEYQDVMFKHFDESEAVAFKDLVTRLDKDGYSHLSADELAQAEEHRADLDVTGAYSHLAGFISHHEL